MLSTNTFHTIITGDFNLPEITWSTSSDEHNYPSAASQVLRNLSSTFILAQRKFIENSNGVILDLIYLTSESATVVADLDPLVREDTHHPALNALICSTFSLKYCRKAYKDLEFQEV